jgi:hypothetical protein
MIFVVDYAEFKARFGATKARKALLAELDDFIATMQANFQHFRVLRLRKFYR